MAARARWHEAVAANKQAILRKSTGVEDVPQGPIPVATATTLTTAGSGRYSFERGSWRIRLGRFSRKASRPSFASSER